MIRNRNHEEKLNAEALNSTFITQTAFKDFYPVRIWQEEEEEEEKSLSLGFLKLVGIIVKMVFKIYKEGRFERKAKGKLIKEKVAVTVMPTSTV